MSLHASPPARQDAAPHSLPVSIATPPPPLLLLLPPAATAATSATACATAPPQVDDAIAGLVRVVRQFVETSFDGLYYGRAADALAALREGCAREDEHDGNGSAAHHPPPGLLFGVGGAVRTT